MEPKESAVQPLVMSSNAMAILLYPINVLRQKIRRTLRRYSLVHAGLWALYSLVSVTTAHYAGFLLQLPNEMLSVVAVSFSETFSLEFYFYLAITLAMSRMSAYLFIFFARALTFVVHAFFFFFFKLVLKFASEGLVRRVPGLEKKYKNNNLIKSIGEDLPSELDSLFSYASQFIAFFVFFWVLYLGLDGDDIHDFLLPPNRVTSVTLSILLISIILALFKIRREPDYLPSSMTVRSTVGALVALSLFAAYSAGHARFNHKINAEAVSVKNDKLDGEYKIILKSDDDLLLLKKEPNRTEYIYYTSEGVFSSEIVSTGDE